MYLKLKVTSEIDPKSVSSYGCEATIALVKCDESDTVVFTGSARIQKDGRLEIQGDQIRNVIEASEMDLEPLENEMLKLWKDAREIQKVRNEKKRKEADEKIIIASRLLKEKAEKMFAPLTVVATANTYCLTIRVTDGTSTVQITRDDSHGFRWVCDCRAHQYNRLNRRSSLVGDKKTSKDLEKLIDFTKNQVRIATNKVKAKLNSEAMEAKNDREMSALGWKGDGKEVYIDGIWIRDSAGGAKYQHKVTSKITGDTIITSVVVKRDDGIEQLTIVSKSIKTIYNKECLPVVDVA